MLEGPAEIPPTRSPYWDKLIGLGKGPLLGRKVGDWNGRTGRNPDSRRRTFRSYSHGSGARGQLNWITTISDWRTGRVLRQLPHNPPIGLGLLFRPSLLPLARLRQLRQSGCLKVGSERFNSFLQKLLAVLPAQPREPGAAPVVS